jgi:hypothetical protein
MAKHSQRSMKERVVFIRRGAGPTALRRIEKAGVSAEPTKKEMARHIHPRRKRRS